MSDEGKIENEIINYSVSRGNKCNQTENERGLRYCKMNHAIAKVGTEQISVPFKLFTTASRKFC